MFEVVFGSKNVEKILIFLFVKGKCYGTQLQRVFNTPLTPLQKVLARLEKGGLISSQFEGKTRVYRFNPAFPLLTELEQFLKKAYTLLPAQEKKAFYFSEDLNKKKHRDIQQELKILFEFWDRLSKVKELTFSAHSKGTENLGWNGRGKGEVIVTKQGDNVLLFNEKGFWRGKDNQEVGFTNVFRWTMDRISRVISLEHLRLGPDRPVFLFHLAPTTLHSLSSIDSHLWEGDSYFGQLHFDRYSLRLFWRVIGPRKNEDIEYCYLSVF